ncbi:hypothetical protein PF004_g24369 [Phytophthora fragariae]|uniref:Uncharacterized protein n=1 Tax=Phytophthora fragariae TaxID=53985 RepID=A0A6G0MUE5_9STRA|nr:hypothetical protein PF004_g24369 [Phytophthora fragariae]
MEKFMDHYGNVAAERKLRTPGSKRRPAGSGVEAGGGVRARAWQAAAGQQQGSWSFGGVHGVGDVANDCFVLLLGTAAAAEAGGGVRAADGNLPLPSRRFVIPEVGRSWRY